MSFCRDLVWLSCRKQKCGKILLCQHFCTDAAKSSSVSEYLSPSTVIECLLFGERVKKCQDFVISNFSLGPNPTFHIRLNINAHTDSVDNIVEENSSVFCLIRMRWLLICYTTNLNLRSYGIV